jgi:Ni/Co efflux regulator RcnB
MIPLTRFLKISLLLSAGCLFTAGLAQGANDDRRDHHDNDRNDQARGQHEQDNDHKWQDDREYQQDSRQQDNRQYRNQRPVQRIRFAEQDRIYVHDYYEREFRGGRCPSGRAKRRMDCWSPGYVKQWQVGQRLSRNVVYYDVPQSLVVQMGRPPAGSRYVRVSSDILLLSIATGLVIDAIIDDDRR